MTEQYQQRNINNPEGARAQANTIAAPNFTLTAADTGKILLFDTSVGGAGTATLPRAAEAGAGAEITIVAVTGGVGPLTIAAIAIAPPDSIEAPAIGAPSNPISADRASRIYRSDGISSWYIVGGVG